MATTIKFYIENTVNINLTFPGVDLTGSTVHFTIKPAFDNDPTDAAAIIKKDITSHTDPTNGKTVIPLTPTDTAVTPGNYGFDIKLKKATGDESTVAIGNVTIKDIYTLRA